ncbi:hypothetical protein L1987_43389 [Smallanthus sonchifolius]|uniref:Uncharacterized protein n=1 Tax=Smallanthus sonchifolius TaxID=185202 RepID=A0ACB9GLL9_9ASTR|nr:hypothetical protein L1987_43389 [Smallanthus sonchifolius]
MEFQESYDDLSVNTVSHETKDGSISNHMKLDSYYDKRVSPTRNIQPPEDGWTSSNTGNKVEGPEMTILDTVGDSIELRSPSVYAGSPPHYQEDILHRRHNLEEEFLQLSAESYSVAIPVIVEMIMGKMVHIFIMNQQLLIFQQSEQLGNGIYEGSLHDAELGTDVYLKKDEWKLGQNTALNSH